MKLVVGLGNPGAEYAGTRHNMGFEVMDRLAGFYDTAFKRINRGKVLAAVARIGHEEVILAKPQTFMNLSGQAVLSLLKKNALSPAALLLVYDDLDLPLGRLRLMHDGSSGGHKGVDSVISAAGTAEFPRMRVGIGRPTGEAADYVLSRFFSEERERVGEVLEAAVGAVDCVLREGMTRAMNKFNRWR
ncbi:MAG: aminoacyl-tRNA hydrolase [Bacillota bacterium]